MYLLKHIRNKRQLSNAAKSSGGRVGIFLLNFGHSMIYSDGIMTVIDKNVYLFLKDYNVGEENVRNKGDMEQMNDLVHLYGYPLSFSLNFFNRNDYNIKLYLKDDEFESEYDKFRAQNKKVIEGYQLNESYNKYLFSLSNGSIHYFIWLIKCLSHVPHQVLESIMLYSVKYKTRLSSLKKGTITAYKSNECLNLLMELSKISIGKRYSEAINLFNTAQKKKLKEYDLSDTDKLNLVKFLKMSDVKKNNFIRKMSTVENAKDILYSLQLIISLNVEWDKLAYLDYINANQDFKYNIIYNKGSILIIEVLDFHTICKIGKNTNWCISKAQNYWRDYVSSRGRVSQYMSFDFSMQEDSDMSIIGFTVDKVNGKILNAHSFTNLDILNNDLHYLKSMKCRGTMKSMLCLTEKDEITDRNIYDYLKKRELSISLFVKDKDIEWNKEVFYDFLKEKGWFDKLITLSESKDYCVMYSNDFNDIYNFVEPEGSLSGTLFIEDVTIISDFTKKKYDDDRIYLLFKTKIIDTYSNSIYISFDIGSRYFYDNSIIMEKLDKLDIPFWFFRNVDLKKNRFMKYLTSYEIEKLSENLLTKSEFDLLDSDEKNSISNLIMTSYYSFKSIDVFEAIYDKGLNLRTYLTDKSIAQIIFKTFEYVNYCITNGRECNELISFAYKLFENEKNQSIINKLWKNLNKIMVSNTSPLYGMLEQIVANAQLKNDVKSFSNAVNLVYNCKDNNLIYLILSKNPSQTLMDNSKLRLKKEVIDFMESFALSNTYSK